MPFQARRQTEPRKTTCCSPALVLALRSREACEFTSAAHKPSNKKATRRQTGAAFARGSFISFCRQLCQTWPRRRAQSGEEPMFIAMNRFKVKKGSEEAF